MAAYGHLSKINAGECWQLLHGHGVGRVGWTNDDGPQIIPVTYSLEDRTIVFRVDPNSLLGSLKEPTVVAFEVDDVDLESRTGWSVLAVGTVSADESSDAEVRPWAPGDRSLTLVIRPDRITGRSVAAY